MTESARDPTTRITNAVDIFAAICAAASARVPMVPRSASDKEYFAQDWFEARLRGLGLRYGVAGRNAYPDFWVEGPEVAEGYEVKSLALSPRGLPARQDFDANSTILSGLIRGRSVFLVFFIYEGHGSSARHVHSVALAHGDFFNDERDVSHENKAVHGFGSYGDGFIRDRKMYVFRHAFAIDPACLGRLRLILPAEWGVVDLRLKKVRTLRRDVAAMRLRSYAVDLLARTVTPTTEPSPRAGLWRRFDIFEHV